MTIHEYETEEEVDAEFDRIEEINLQYYDLKQAVEIASDELEEAKNNLDEAVKELEQFEAENDSLIIGL